MLVYTLLKITPDGGEFADTALGTLFSVMEAGMVVWMIAEMVLCW